LKRRTEISDGEDKKKRVSTCKVIRSINHTLLFDVILSVNTSVIAVGFILVQLDAKGQ